MLLPPLEILLTWPKPNYVNPDRQPAIMVPIIVAMTVICVIIVALRLYVRAFILKAFKADDWLIIAALIAAIGVSITCSLSERAGVGMHVWDLRPLQQRDLKMWSFATQITFTWSVSLTKVSILLFYLRFCTTRAFKWSIFGTLGFIGIYLTTWTFLVIFQCVPVEAYWRPGPPLPTDKCIMIQNEMHLLHGSTNLISDVIVLMLPIPTVLKLQMPLRQKVSLICVFTLGIVAPLSAILRLVYIEKATTSYDAAWWCTELWIFTCLETHVGIVCASIPSLKPLIIKIFPRFGSSQMYGDNTSPMAFHSSSGGASGVRSHSRSQAHSGAGSSRAERNGKIRSIYPLASIVSVGHDERGESQESIVTKGGISGFSGNSDVITSFSSGGPPRVPPKEGTVVKTTEINVTMWDGKKYTDV